MVKCLTVMLQVDGCEFTEYDKKKRQGPFEIKIGCSSCTTYWQQDQTRVLLAMAQRMEESPIC